MRSEFAQYSVLFTIIFLWSLKINIENVLSANRFKHFSNELTRQLFNLFRVQLLPMSLGCATLAFDVIISSLKREFQALFEDIAFIVLKGDSLLAATSNYPWNLVCLNQYVYFVLMVFVPYQDNECLPHWYLPPDRPSPFAKFSMSQRSSLEGLPTAKKSYIRNLVFSITINPFIQDFVN